MEILVPTQPTSRQERPALTESRLPSARPQGISPAATAPAACAAAALVLLVVFCLLPEAPDRLPAWYLAPLLAGIFACLAAVVLAVVANRKIPNLTRPERRFLAAGTVLAVVLLPPLGLLSLAASMAFSCGNNCF